MTWTYLGKSRLARAASALYADRACACALSPYIFMTDPKRTPDVLRKAANLPRASTLIYRHFGAENKTAVATALRQICFVRDVQFLIAQDEKLAVESGADGLHLPEKYLAHAPKLRARYPEWLLCGAVHSSAALDMTSGLDAAILSPVFASDSPSAGKPIGIKKFTELVNNAPLSVFALGGITPTNVSQLLESGAAGIAGVSAFGGGALAGPLAGPLGSALGSALGSGR